MSRIKELTDDELRQKISECKNVGDLEVGNYESVIIAVYIQGKWYAKSIINCVVEELQVKKIINCPAELRRPILLNVPEKILIDQKTGIVYNKDTKVKYRFGFSTKPKNIKSRSRMK